MAAIPRMSFGDDFDDGIAYFLVDLALITQSSERALANLGHSSPS